MKKIIAFDLDGTLAPSKSPLPDKMGLLIKSLLQKFEVCVMSGGKFGQFETQLLNNLQATPAELQRLHLMPTCGTRYYLFDITSARWKMQYAEDFTEKEKKKITAALTKGINTLGYKEEKTYGETIEDRGSQITFSALGQDIVAELGEEGVRLKDEWDPDTAKKTKLRDFVANLLPDFEVRIGGGTSIDITKPGIDKAYGMKKLLTLLDMSKEDVLFVGDRLEEGGNDYPVLEMGVDSIAVYKWEDTALVIETVLKTA
jgi:phosphomannomutase